MIRIFILVVILGAILFSIYKLKENKAQEKLDSSNLSDSAEKAKKEIEENILHLNNLFQTNVKSTIKEVIGKYSIYDLTSQTESISKQVWDEMNKKCANMPIVITQLNVNNWSWSESFDKQIQETMKRTQMEKTAKADVAIAEAAAQKQVKEAEAKKQADLLKADAELEVAKKESEAAKVKADADLYVKTKLAQQLSTNERQWKHEEVMSFLDKWDGRMPGAAATTNVGGNSNSNMLDAIMAKALSGK